MALSRFYLRSVHKLAYNAVSCKFNGVSLMPAVCSRNLPDFGKLLESSSGHMKFSGTHWKCIEYSTSLVPLIDEK